MGFTLITTLLGVAAALFGIILDWTAKAKETEKDPRKDAEANTTLSTDMEYLKRRVNDMRLEQRTQGQRVDAMGEPLTRVEESSKQAHKRIDRIERKERKHAAH